MSKHAVVVLLVFFMAAQATAIAVAQTNQEKQATTTDKYSVIGGDSLLANNSVFKSKNLGQGAGLARKLIRTTATAYSSSPDETDDTPNITASGTYTHDGVVASNFLPLGSKIRIPKIFGAKIFTVEDRMSERFADRVDIWFATKISALKFGLRAVDIEVL
ncbi:MAG: 3D domain-containing protein [Candidatus Wolfebacteria bacterium]|nr:3D domain-containing protein [Candidatus Wolfebacteria bacterium]